MMPVSERGELITDAALARRRVMTRAGDGLRANVSRRSSTSLAALFNPDGCGLT
jgi:hypothetical protein